MGDLLLPVGVRRMSSWAQHQRRSPRSQEPGTDFYCPIGTHILAPADGYVWGSSESIIPAAGRWVGINFDNGMSFRSLHHSRNRITSGRVRRGDVIAFSGASGYGEEDWSWNPDTGGAHTHVTLWPTHDHRYGYRADGTPYTIDFMNYIGGAQSDGSTPFPMPDEPSPETTQYTLEDDMTHPIAYVKGDRSPEVYAVYLDAGANHPDAPTQGGVYCARRYVTKGEYDIAMMNGYTVQTIGQDDFDKLPKVFGSDNLKS